MNTLTTQIKPCELCQVWQALTQSICSLDANTVSCTHHITSHINVTSHTHTHQVTHQYAHTHCTSQGVWGVSSLASTDSVLLLPRLQSCSLYSHHITHHITSHHITSSNTSFHTLTTQVNPCELCQVCQALAHWICSFSSNEDVCTLTHHTSHQTQQVTHQVTHINEHTHDSNSGMWVVSSLASIDSVHLLPQLQSCSLYSHTSYQTHQCDITHIRHTK